MVGSIVGVVAVVMIGAAMWRKRRESRH